MRWEIPAPTWPVSHTCSRQTHLQDFAAIRCDIRRRSWWREETKSSSDNETSGSGGLKKRRCGRTKAERMKTEKSTGIKCSPGVMVGFYQILCVYVCLYLCCRPKLTQGSSEEACFSFCSPPQDGWTGKSRIYPDTRNNLEREREGKENTHT